ncbi:hypothetical protein PR202_ga13606 [Eleusine coracana subsp. coracana]|uniref:RNase H type-1 domain-containing protein n=1 Tax=Eleusine coracana subsp. coracana TaxID=191504 RepID=A0AAV5CEK0_ELECO|nr:hypothetical protein PR202_ga13606 [Eleusine coracana subsp. coracana]
MLPMQQAVQWARDTTFDLWQILHPAKQAKQEVNCRKWQRPNEGWHKCNTDGAFNPSDSSGATGTVMRDKDGKFLAARAECSRRQAAVEPETSCAAAAATNRRDGVRRSRGGVLLAFLLHDHHGSKP